MRVPLYRHNLHGQDLDAIADEFRKVIGTMSISTGPICNEIQKLFSNYMGTNHCRLTNNWTNAAIASLMTLGIGRNDEVIIPALTFAGTINAVIAVGARPVLVDIDPDTKLMDLDLAMKALNYKTKAIMPVHLYGQMVDVKLLKEMLSVKYSHVAILEDAAHAIESELNGYKPGAHSTAAMFSFYASKNLTTGEGGAMVTNNDEFLSSFTIKYRHGIDLCGYTRHISNEFIEPLMVSAGIKGNMPDTQALLLRPQLENINQTHSKRLHRAQIYLEKLSKLDIEFPKLVPNSVHAWHLFTIGVDPDRREKILHDLDNRGIRTTMHYRSLNDMPFVQEKYGVGPNSFPNATLWGRKTISLPIFPDLTDEEQEYVIDVLKDII